MPTPIEILSDPVSITVIALYAGLIVWEAVAPARDLPRVKGWKLRGLVWFAGFFYLSSYLPLIWDGYLAEYRVLDLTGLGTWGGAAVGLLAFEAGLYAWHRTMHKTKPLWRGFHQMHHSAERLDTFGAFYFSPLDVIGLTAAGSLCTTLFVGVSPRAATVIVLATTFCTIFQHANIRTPRWIGYLLQRPESHSVHHATGIHAFNYADLPVVDMLFRTFRNPADFAPQTGFYPGASDRVTDMLLFRDVSEPETEGAAAVPQQT